VLTATGTVVKAGSRVGFTEGVATDASGALVAYELVVGAADALVTAAAAYCPWIFGG
jgi:hypothetical protein